MISGDNANILKNIELRIDPDPSCTSCHTSLINKKNGSKTASNSKALFKWVFMDIIPGTPPIVLTSETTFSNYLFIGDAWKKTPKLYVMEKLSPGSDG